MPNSKVTLRNAEALTGLRQIWAHPGAVENTGWPQQGVAILGDLSGIQAYVLRPVPGAGGAARRLRARSFRVSAWSELIARSVLTEFAGEEASKFYSAGGHFLIRINPCSNWEDRLERLQRDLDVWLFQEMEGEVLFHLAGCEFHDGKMPGDLLHRRLRESRRRPLRGALQSGDRKWNGSAFFRQTAAGSDRCRACVRTVTKIVKVGDEEMCESCAADTRLGANLAMTPEPTLMPDAKGPVRSFGGAAYRVAAEGQAQQGAVSMRVVRWMPRRGAEVLSLEDLAEFAPGDHKWLGYLRMDADGVGQEFRALGGSPARTAALSRLLDQFFTDGIQDLISRWFPNIYPVYGGGDDLFVVGAWRQVVDFAAELQFQFGQAVQDKLTLSAGLAFASAHEHVLSGSRQAARNLEMVKGDKKNAFRLFGDNIEWADFSRVLEDGRTAARWAAQGNRRPELPKAFLHRLLGLHNQWTLLKARAERIRAGARESGPRLNPARVAALLNYHIQRNLPGRQQEVQRVWAERFLNLAGPQWRHAGFIARYAILASGKEQ